MYAHSAGALVARLFAPFWLANRTWLPLAVGRCVKNHPNRSGVEVLGDQVFSCLLVSLSSGSHGCVHRLRPSKRKCVGRISAIYHCVDGANQRCPRTGALGLTTPAHVLACLMRCVIAQPTTRARLLYSACLQVPLPSSGWKWLDPVWRVADASTGVDGWLYATDFPSSFHSDNRPLVRPCRPLCVRGPQASCYRMLCDAVGGRDVVCSERPWRRRCRQLCCWAFLCLQTAPGGLPRTAIVFAFGSYRHSVRPQRWPQWPRRLGRIRLRRQFSAS